MRRRRFVAGVWAVAGASLAGCSAVRPPASFDLPVRFAATVERANPTDRHPPLVRLSVTNRDDAPHTLAVPTHPFPFAGGTTAADGHSVVLDDDVPETRDGECWTEYARVLPMVTSREFAPRETASRRYAVLNDAEGGECWPPGSYEFALPFSLDPTEPGRLGTGTELTWYLTLTIAADGTVTVPAAESHVAAPEG